MADNYGEGLSVGKTGKNGITQFATPAEIEAAQLEMEEAESEQEEMEYQQYLNSLEGYLAAEFEDARNWKEGESDIQNIIIDSLNRRNGKYSAEKLAKIKTAGSSDVFIGVTGIKCRAFESWVHDIYVNAKRKRTWSLKPTPIVDLPKEDQTRIAASVMQKYQEALAAGVEMTEIQAYELASQMRADIITSEYKEAGKKADRMSRIIHDQMIQGNWIEAFDKAIMDLSSSKAAIIKGPIFRKRKTKTGFKKKKGKTVIEYGEEIVPTFERVSPLDLYPGRSCENVNDGFLAERMIISRQSLLLNRDEDGYIRKNIEKVAQYSTRGSSVYTDSYRQERDDAENKDTDMPRMSSSSMLEAIEYWCCVPGKMLPMYGITKDVAGKKLDPLMDYDVNAITVDGCVVFVKLNEDPMQKRPYSVYGYAKEIGGFWYQGIPELIKNEQDIANAAARAMVNNLGISSGPQVVIPDTNRIPAGQDIGSMHPWKIWQGTNMGNTTAPLVDFFQPDSRSNEMLGVITQAFKITDTTLEMPAYSYGGDKVAGAGRTATGLSMLMGSSSKGLKRILMGLDRYIFQTIVERLYDWNMMNSEDDLIKGDMQFMSEGIMSMIMKEQLSTARLNLLNATNNEFDMKILGLEGRSKILSDALESLESDYEDIAPSQEKIERLIQEETILQQQAIQENQIRMQREQAIMERENQVAMAELQMKAQELDLKAQKISLDNATDNKELDIRAAKQSQAAMGEILKAREATNVGQTELGGGGGDQGAGEQQPDV